MQSILQGYAVNEPTWFYLSLLLVCAVYTRFQRPWSVRNLDLALLLALSPGLLLVRTVPILGYNVLFVVTGLLLVRMLNDGSMDRRPRVQPNMNAAGLSFLCGAAFLFLTSKVCTEVPPSSTVQSVRRAEGLIIGEQKPVTPPEAAPDGTAGPVPSLVAAPVVLTSKALAGGEGATGNAARSIELWTARIIAILAHLAVISALALIGRNLYGDLETGIAMSTLYMLLPCTSYDVQTVTHVLPAAFIVWAIYCFRQPVWSGLFMGLAAGTLFFPIFLIPLWAAFYGREAIFRFLGAVVATAVVVLTGMLLLAGGAPDFVRDTLGYIEWAQLQLRVVDSVPGFWNNVQPAYRIPVIVSFALLLVGVTVWPRKKHLGHLIAWSTAIILGTQFWYTREGGVYVLWYLPLALLVMFRPSAGHLIALQSRPALVNREIESPSSVNYSGGMSAVASQRVSPWPAGTLFR